MFVTFVLINTTSAPARVVRRNKAPEALSYSPDLSVTSYVVIYESLGNHSVSVSLSFFVCITSSVEHLLLSLPQLSSFWLTVLAEELIREQKIY